VDFSDCSNQAFAYAASLATHLGARLFIQHTIAPLDNLYLAGLGPGVINVSIEEQFRSSRQEIWQIIARSSLDPAEVTVLLNQGGVLERILKTVAKEGIDLIVMGTHGRRGFNRLLLGSVADQVIHRAPCPVLVVRAPRGDHSIPGAPEPHIRTILLATDFFPHWQHAARYAMKWAWECDCSLVVVHVAPEGSSAIEAPIDPLPEYNPAVGSKVARAWRELQALSPEHGRSCCKPILEIRQGHPAEEILRVAEENNADMIILGARSVSRDSAGGGSVSSAVIRDGRFPLLVVAGKVSAETH
jgi:nucleotide-binding universal stress UspA family protein